MFRYRLSNGQFIYSPEIIRIEIPGLVWAPDYVANLEQFLRIVLAILAFCVLLGSYLYSTRSRTLCFLSRYASRLASWMFGRGVIQPPVRPVNRVQPQIQPDPLNRVEIIEAPAPARRQQVDAGIQVDNIQFQFPEAANENQDDNRNLRQMADGTPEFYQWLRSVERRRRQDAI